MNWLKKVLKGYKSLFQGFGLIGAFILISAIVSVVIVWPLFWVSQNYPRVYSWTTLSFFTGILLIYLLIVKKNQIKAAGGWKNYSKSSFLPFLKKTGSFVALILAGLGTLFVWNNSMNILIQSLSILVFILILGYGLYRISPESQKK